MTSRRTFEQIREHAKRASLVHWDSGSLAAIEQLCDQQLAETESAGREEMAARFDRAASCRLRIPFNEFHDDVIEGDELKRVAAMIRGV